MSKLVTYFVFFLAYCFLSFNASAVLANDRELGNKNAVQYLQTDNVTNQIPYFNNRFRLDADLDEITLIFYRKSGSRPIILIRPDGSKIRVNEFDHEKVQWFDDSTFDMIKIKKPMPGPWQAVGDILPHSHILIVSDVTIEVEPLPKVVFSGETLKVEGKLFNGGEAIETPEFKKVVHLDVNFYSTNDSQYENFGAAAIKVASFRDDGRGLDEYASDNTFTGEFFLNFAAGEWQPVYLIKLPMATRELRQEPIVLQKNPVRITVDTSQDAEKPHQLHLSIDPNYVVPNSLVFQGTFTFPDRQIQPFSIMEEDSDNRTATITNTEPGIYRVNVSAFGKTITGREFRLVVPEFSFNVEMDNDLIDEKINVDGEAAVVETVSEIRIKAEQKAEQERAEALLAKQVAQEQAEKETLIIIAAGNVIVMLCAAIWFFIVRRKKKSK